MKKVIPLTRKALEKLYAEARQETEKFRTEAAELRELKDRFGKSLNKLDAEKSEAEKDRDNLRERLDDLKEKYAETRNANARLTGYLDRVYEDDVVREDVIEVEGHNGHKAKQPKRPQPIRELGHERGIYARERGAEFISGELRNYGAENRRLPHWSRY